MYLEADNMPFLKSYFHFVNIDSIPRWISGEKLDIWDDSLYFYFKGLSMNKGLKPQFHVCVRSERISIALNKSRTMGYQASKQIKKDLKN